MFLLLAFGVLVFLSGLFKYDQGYMSQAFYDYKDQKKGTVDAVYIGSSAVNRYWIAAQAYEDYGMTVYPLSTDSQPVWLVKTMIQEALTTQDPKLIIIDIRSFAISEEEALERAERASRYIIDELPFFSPRRLSAVNRSLALMHRLDPEEHFRIDISYYFPFIRFHSKWDNDTFSFDELKPVPSKYLGFYIQKKNTLHVYQQDMNLNSTKNMEPLEPWCREYLEELLDYLKKNNLNALFVNTPHDAEDWALARYNTVEQIVTEAGFPYLSYLSEEKLAENIFDPKADFYNKGHVNYEGAKKYTADLSAYLDQHFDLPDHRGDPALERWNGVNDKIKKKIQQLKGK